MDAPQTMAPRYRPLLPEARDQGDPYALVPPPDAGARFRCYVYTTGEEPAAGAAFPVYGSDDLIAWHAIGESLAVGEPTAHWAPCVVYRPDLDPARPYVMLYSRAVGVGEQAHVGHAIRRAVAAQPEGPFEDTGHVLTPELDFAIDPDVYRAPDGSLRLAFAMDFVDDEPYGTGIVEADLAEDLTHVIGEPRVLARPRHPWHVYEAERVMPWKAIPGVDWSDPARTVRWHTVEAPVGGLRSPTGDPVYLYSGGCFWGFYAVGALVERHGILEDVTDGERNFVIQPDPQRGFYGPGHCSLLRMDGRDFLLLHARFGAPHAKRQMCLAPVGWTAEGLPVAGDGG